MRKSDTTGVSGFLITGAVVVGCLLAGTDHLDKTKQTSAEAGVDPSCTAQLPHAAAAIGASKTDGKAYKDSTENLCRAFMDVKNNEVIVEWRPIAPNEPRIGHYIDEKGPA